MATPTWKPSSASSPTATDFGTTTSTIKTPSTAGSSTSRGLLLWNRIRERAGQVRCCGGKEKLFLGPLYSAEYAFQRPGKTFVSTSLRSQMLGVKGSQVQILSARLLERLRRSGACG